MTADIRRAKTRALEEMPVSPQVAKTSLQNLHAYIRIRVAWSRVSQCGRNEV